MEVLRRQEQRRRRDCWSRTLSVGEREVVAVAAAVGVVVDRRIAAVVGKVAVVAYILPVAFVAAERVVDAACTASPPPGHIVHQYRIHEE